MRPLLFWLLGFLKSDRGESMWIRVQTSTWRLSKMLFLWGCSAVLGNNGKRTVTDAALKLQDWKTGQKSLECPGALTKQEIESRVGWGKAGKLEKSVRWCNFTRRARLGNNIQFFLSKNVGQNTGSNIMTLKKARKCHINYCRWVFLFYSFLSNWDCAPTSTQKPLLPCKTDILKMLEGETSGEPREQDRLPQKTMAT